jgi:hypothetical protein
MPVEAPQKERTTSQSIVEPIAQIEIVCSSAQIHHLWRATNHRVLSGYIRGGLFRRDR